MGAVPDCGLTIASRSSASRRGFSALSTSSLIPLRSDTISYDTGERRAPYLVQGEEGFGYSTLPVALPVPPWRLVGVHYSDDIATDDEDPPFANLIEARHVLLRHPERVLRALG